MTVIWPVLWPMLMAAILLSFWRHPVLQRRLAIAGGLVHVGLTVELMRSVLATGMIVTAVGDWQPPVGIVFVGDRLGAAMALITAVIGLCVAVYSLSGIDTRREAYGYHTLVQALLAGVCGAFLTGDFFNLYVWFEVMLMSSFVLLALGGEKRQMVGALQYFALNLISSMTFLIALGLLYGLVGTLNMADVAAKLPSTGQPGLVGAICCLFAVAFGVKSAVFPLYVWLPASYHTPPTVVTALFAGLLTKVGVYALMRSASLLFVPSAVFLMDILLVVGLLTMVFGVLGAVSQKEFRRVLSFHIVSQIGYMILGLALWTPLAVAAGVFYVLHHILVKTNLFFISGISKRMCHTEVLKDMGGLYARSPLLSLLFLIPAMSLAGIPPLSGFWAKFFVVHAGLEAREYWAVGIALVVGLLTLFSMLKLWNEAFWKPAPGGLPEEYEPAMGRQRWRYLPVVALAGLTVAFGFLAGPLLDFSQATAAELMAPNIYIEAVLGGAR